MANIIIIDLGTAPNDGTGDPLRTGGQDINANFQELNVYKLETGGFSGTAQDLSNTINSVALAGTPNGGYPGTAQDLFNLINTSDIDSIVFTPQTVPVPYERGKLYYDDARDSLIFLNESPNVALNIGEEVIIRIFNDTGSTIANGTVVQFDGSSGTNPTVKIPIADSFANARISACATEDIADGATGYVTILGLLGYDTTGLADGTELYLSSITPGLLTVNPPRVTVLCAIVVTGNSTDGIIAFKAVAPTSEGAIGQTAGVGIIQDTITTTDQPISTFDQSLNLAQNVTVTNTPAGNGERGVLTISPLIRFSGYYKLNFTVNGTSADNDLFIFTLFINGTPTSIFTGLDLSNNNTNNGNASFNGVIPQILTPGDVLEWNVKKSAGGGTSTLTFENVVFALDLSLNI